MGDDYYTVDTCANEQGDIYYQRVQHIEDGIAATIAYWNAGMKVPAGAEARSLQFHSFNEVIAARFPGGRDLLHTMVARRLKQSSAAM